MTDPERALEAITAAAGGGPAKSPPIASNEERARRVELATRAAREFPAPRVIGEQCRKLAEQVAESEAARDGVAYTQGVRLCLRDLE